MRRPEWYVATRLLRHHMPAVDDQVMPKKAQTGQLGVTLVELMVALSIGLIVLLAITVLFSQISSGFRASDDGARAVENGNFGVRVIGEDLRMAGFIGLFNDPARVDYARSNMISGSTSNNCGSATWPFKLYDVASNKVGYVEHIADPGSLSCIPAGSYLASSPALVVRHASGIQASAADLTTSNLYIQSSQSGAIVFMGKDYATQVKGADRHLQVCKYTPGPGTCTSTGSCKCPTTGSKANTGTVALADAPIFQYLAHVYYVRPCNRPAGAVCAATDDGGEPIPTLVRRQLSNTDPAVFVETPIAEGVERMVLSYGIDTNGDGVPEQYTSTPADLGSAVTVRMSLLMRTRKMEPSYDDSVMTYTLADGSTFNCGATGTTPCRYRRYVMNDTVQLKNYVFRH